jgi:hypothetical protein
MRQKLFRPSSAPPKEICVYFENLELQTEEKEEGDQHHKDYRAVFKGEKQIDGIPKSRREKALWGVEVQKQYVPWVTGVERHVELYGEADQFITEGTIDLDGETEFEGGRIPALVDWKPGDYIDRMAQLTTYALARMDEARSPYCQITAAYYNQGHVESQVISYAYAQERVGKLVDRLMGRRGPELHNISVWCSFCSVRMSPKGCPAWEANRLTLAETKGFPAELNDSLLAIKGDPQRRAKFIIAMRHFNALCDAYGFEDDAMKDIMDGKPGFGLKKQSRGYSLVIDKDYKELTNGETNIQASPAISQAEPGAA